MNRIFISPLLAIVFMVAIPASYGKDTGKAKSLPVSSNPIATQLADSSDNDAFIRVNRLDHRYFELSNNKTFIPIGPNICFPRFETEEEKVFALYERQFRELHLNGGNYSRIYLSAPFWEVEHEKAGEYDPKFAERLNRLLGLARKYQIKVKFCFEFFRTVENVPPGFKYAISFGKPIYSTKYGGPLTSIADFLNLEKGRDLYRNRMKFFAGLYGSNPQVFAWELWNEMNCIGTSQEQLEWTDIMLTEAHRLFPNHLVVQNLGSFDDDQIRKTYRQITTMPINDYAQIHRYLDPGANLDVCRGPMDVLTSDAIVELKKYNEDKPVILAETGAVEYRHAGPSKLYETDKEGILLHDLLFAPFFSGSAGPGQSWHWSYYIDMNNLWWHYGRFSTAIRNFDPVSEKVIPIRLDQKHFRVYVLKGLHSDLIWIRDSNTNWNTELIEKIAAPVNQNEAFENWPMQLPETVKVTIYDPWKNQWSKGEWIKGKIRLPDFKRSILIRIEKD